MTATEFFKYYIPSLKKALTEDHINYGFMVKGPDWWYPYEWADEMDAFEDSCYKEFPLLEKVAYYFDAKSHYFTSIKELDLDDYKKEILQSLSKLEAKYYVVSTADSYVPKRSILKANFIPNTDLLIEFSEKDKDYYVNIILGGLDKLEAFSGKYTVEDMSEDYILLTKEKDTPNWNLIEMGLPPIIQEGVQPKNRFRNLKNRFNKLISGKK